MKRKGSHVAPLSFCDLSIGMKMGFLTSLKKAWQGIQVDDDDDKRTRYVMTIWSFLLLSAIIIACFVAALLVSEVEIRLAFIDLMKHLAYVFGGILATYFGLESFFPSEARDYPGWGGWGHNRKEVEVDPKKDPPVHPSNNDAQVD